MRTQFQAGAWLWLGCCQFFVAEQIARLGWAGHYSMARDYISDLGAVHCELHACSSLHWLMDGSFVLQGLLIFFGTVLVWGLFAGSTLDRIGLGLLAIAGIGVLFVGLAPEDVNFRFHILGAVANFSRQRFGDGVARDGDDAALSVPRDRGQGEGLDHLCCRVCGAAGDGGVGLSWQPVLGSSGLAGGYCGEVGGVSAAAVVDVDGLFVAAFPQQLVEVIREGFSAGGVVRAFAHPTLRKSPKDGAPLFVVYLRVLRASLAEDEHSEEKDPEHSHGVPVPGSAVHDDLPQFDAAEKNERQHCAGKRHYSQ